ncbi:MAG: type II toxin-antitoxin system HicA family toxin [Methanosarcinaceae archaeon]
MSPKLPVVSGKKVIQLLKKTGYEIIRQRGSHIRLTKSTINGRTSYYSSKSQNYC